MDMVHHQVHLFTFLLGDMAWDADHRGVGGNVPDNDRVGADVTVVADGNIAQNLGAGPDDHIVADRRMPFAGFPCPSLPK